MSTNFLREWYYNLSQKELSEITGISLRTITNWDNRNCMPVYMYRSMQAVFDLVKDLFFVTWRRFPEKEEFLKDVKNRFRV